MTREVKWSEVKMELADTIYLYETRRGNGQEDHESKTYILKAIEDNHMAPLYTHLSEKFTWAVNEELLASMR